MPYSQPPRPYPPAPAPMSCFISPTEPQHQQPPSQSSCTEGIHQNHRFGGRGHPRMAMPTRQIVAGPTVPDVQNVNTDTILLDHPHGHSSLNTLYKVANTITTRQHINTASAPMHHWDCLNNVYEFPSIEPTIRYLPTAAGYSVKATWLKAIRNGNYNTLSSSGPSMSTTPCTPRIKQDASHSCQAMATDT
jgi:hypothetical protein